MVPPHLLLCTHTCGGCYRQQLLQLISPLIASGSGNSRVKKLGSGQHAERREGALSRHAAAVNMVCRCHGIITSIYFVIRASDHIRGTITRCHEIMTHRTRVQVHSISWRGSHLSSSIAVLSAPSASQIKVSPTRSSWKNCMARDAKSLCVSGSSGATTVARL